MIIITIFSVISAIATCIIAYSSHRLAKNINKSTGQHRQELYDLYQAMVVATFISGPAGSNLNAQKDNIKTFKKLYNDKTKIFPADAN